MSTTDLPMLQIENVSHAFGLKPVLKKVSLHIPEGQYLALLGANGAGKTTLIRIVSTLMRPTAGLVTIGGYRLPREAGSARQLIGLVGHNPLLYTELSAHENLRLYAQLYGLHLTPAQMDRALDDVGLLRRRNDLVRNFSRGMQQRLAIARATLHQPRLMLCDEPHTGLDQQASTMLDAVLRRLVTQGCTVVMATHDLRRAVTESHRVVILRNGQVVFDQPAASLDPDTFPKLFSEVGHG